MARRPLNAPPQADATHDRVSRALKEFFEKSSPQEVFEAAQESSPELYRDGELIEVSPQQQEAEDMKRRATLATAGESQPNANGVPESDQESRKPSQR